MEGRGGKNRVLVVGVSWRASRSQWKLYFGEDDNFDLEELNDDADGYRFP